ncbi:MAG: DNA polymerase III subunit alpha, partial [Elusimicrobiota bacterium]|nr:DNA polymerase III subunit alpha [Elusimicrobiota bacterium]
FLIVSDFIQYAKSKKIPVGPGRGSGAGSIVTYALGITDICPLKYGLLFERFLNPDRISMPDLDIDFADSGRDEVIQYVREKYGEEKCAQIITFGSMKARNAIKDVARTMDFAVVESNNIAKLIDQNLTISEALIQSKELKTLVEKSERIAELIKAAKKLEGLKRHTGVHAAGMIIADEEIIKYSPLAKGRDDIITTQYDGVVLPELGLLKVDFLGLRTLTIIDECVADIKIKNPDFNMDDIPLDDKKTYELLESAKTFGVFQLESKGIRDLISRLKPSVIDDVIALVALYRPGPMGSGMLDDFVNRKHGRTPIVYDHPLQETILKDSYGVILYQEQAMKMAVSLAGFTPGQSDKLRKAMSKKNTEVFKEQREKFTKGAEEKGITLRVANRIFDNIERFAGYGFNKSHSAAYGVLSYRTAYLKANFPLEYMTALLNSEVGRSNTKDGEESRIKTYLDDLESFGIKILPPDIQSSDGKFKIEGENIRFGLLAVKGVGQTFAESIEDSRKDEIFKNWDNFLERIDLKSTNKTGFENLAKAGAFDCFDSDKFSIRANIVRNIESYIDKASKIKKDKETSQGFLFDTKATFTATILSKNAKPLELFEALNYEKEVLGFYLSGHPLSAREKEIMAYSNYSLDKLPAPKPGVDYKSAKSVRIAGMIVFVKKLTSKKDKKPYAKFKLEDLSGSVDVVMFNKKFEEFERYLAPNNIIVVKGLLMGTSEALEIVVDQIWTVDEAKKTFEPKDLEVCIKLSTARYDDDLNKKLVTFFSSYKGKSKLSFHLEDSSHGNFAVETPYLINCCDDFVAGVEKIIGYKNCINFRYCG